MTKLEMTIRQVSDLRDFYMKIKKKGKNHKAGNKALPPTFKGINTEFKREKDRVW